MFMVRPPIVRSRFSDWPLATKSILGFWLVYYSTVVARAFLTDDAGTIMFNRALTLVIGIFLTAGIYVVFAMFARSAGMTRRIVPSIWSISRAVVAQYVQILYRNRIGTVPGQPDMFAQRLHRITVVLHLVQ